MTTRGNTYCFTLISLLTVKTKEYIYTQKVFIALFRKSYNNRISGAFPYFINNETRAHKRIEMTSSSINFRQFGMRCKVCYLSVQVKILHATVFLYTTNLVYLARLSFFAERQGKFLFLTPENCPGLDK